MSWYSQDLYDIRTEWGLEGARNLSTEADVTIVIDILSFSTCVDVGVSRGARIFPFLFRDERLNEFARSIDAIIASTSRSKTEFCLSPQTLNQLKPGNRLVLPSPNGSSICFSIQSPHILCGCLRNSKAVAEYAMKLGNKILIVAAGEKWSTDQSLRPSLEDLIGAGAMINYLCGIKSPESLAALAVFKEFENKLNKTIQNCTSGQELIERGYPEDIEWSTHLNVSKTVPMLTDGYFIDAGVPNA